MAPSQLKVCFILKRVLDWAALLLCNLSAPHLRVRTHTNTRTCFRSTVNKIPMNGVGRKRHLTLLDLSLPLVSSVSIVINLLEHNHFHPQWNASRSIIKGLAAGVPTLLGKGGEEERGIREGEEEKRGNWNTTVPLTSPTAACCLALMTHLIRRGPHWWKSAFVLMP